MKRRIKMKKLLNSIVGLGMISACAHKGDTTTTSQNSEPEEAIRDVAQVDVGNGGLDDEHLQLEHWKTLVGEYHEKERKKYPRSYKFIKEAPLANLYFCTQRGMDSKRYYLKVKNANSGRFRGVQLEGNLSIKYRLLSSIEVPINNVGVSKLFGGESYWFDRSAKREMLLAHYARRTIFPLSTKMGYDSLLPDFDAKGMQLKIYPDGSGKLIMPFKNIGTGNSFRTDPLIDGLGSHPVETELSCEGQK
jgi:hypothetical protein